MSVRGGLSGRNDSTARRDEKVLCNGEKSLAYGKRRPAYRKNRWPARFGRRRDQEIKKPCRKQFATRSWHDPDANARRRNGIIRTLNRSIRSIADSATAQPKRR
jgi:hypothetical protein